MNGGCGQSAAEALAELFSSGGAGKTFDTVEKKIAEAWTIAFRVADDIKGNRSNPWNDVCKVIEIVIPYD